MFNIRMNLMAIRFSIIILITACFVPINSLLANDEFYAYYTKVQHSATDYLSEYADIIVVLDEGKQIEFTRQTNYQPLWVTPNGSFLIDDLNPGKDADYTFEYTYVRLIENSPEKIVVHWRYMTNTNVLEFANRNIDPVIMDGFTGVVHELFTIYPDGTVEREIKEAKGSIFEQWKSDEYATHQTIKLLDNGIDHGKVNWGNQNESEIEYIKGTPVVNESKLEKPVIAFNFNGEILEDDEEPHMRDEIFEKYSEEEYLMQGLMMVYKKGVSGTSIAFDGYYSGISAELVEVDLSNGFSVDAWIALDVYPYNNAPVVHQSKNFGESGYYLGIDAYGHLLFALNGTTIKSKEVIPLYTWTNVSACVGNGNIDLYINGRKVNASHYNGGIHIPEVPMLIGINSKKERCTDFVRTNQQNIPFIYGLQGLLDEIRIYNKSLSENQINDNYRAFEPQDKKSPLKKGVLPGELGVAKEFGAYYKTLEFQDLWDNMWRLTDFSDVVVKFDNQPTSIVYWHGSNYAANYVTDNNRWMADQSSEIWGKHGCSEHMADKQNRHSYVRIIENSPARVVVHWRYPCVDVGYNCDDRRNWSDEIHTIYPDGTAVRKVNWNKGDDKPGFQDIQFFTNPGETALDVMNLQAMTLANTKGEVLKLTWEPPNKVPENTLEDATIELLNSKSEYKVFTIFQGGYISPWGSVEQSEYTEDPFAGPWNHWPMHLVPSDGRFAITHDRVTHFAIGANDYTPEFGSLVQYGFTNQDIETLLPIAKYWQNPPPVKNVQGAGFKEFSKEEKAYIFTEASDQMSFSIEAEEKSPVVNPCFILNKWNGKKVSVKVNGAKMKDGLRIGKARDTNGELKLIIWMKYMSEKPTKIDIIAG